MIRLCVNDCGPGCGGFTDEGISQSLYNWKLPWLSIELRRLIWICIVSYPFLWRGVSRLKRLKAIYFSVAESRAAGEQAEVVVHPKKRRRKDSDSDLKEDHAKLEQINSK